jgi:hypothetical protein
MASRYPLRRRHTWSEADFVDDSLEDGNSARGYAASEGSSDYEEHGSAEDDGGDTASEFDAEDDGELDEEDDIDEDEDDDDHGDVLRQIDDGEMKPYSDDESHVDRHVDDDISMNERVTDNGHDDDDDDASIASSDYRAQQLPLPPRTAASQGTGAWLTVDRILPTRRMPRWLCSNCADLARRGRPYYCTASVPGHNAGVSARCVQCILWRCKCNVARHRVCLSCSLSTPSLFSSSLLSVICL